MADDTYKEEPKKWEIKPEGTKPVNTVNNVWVKTPLIKPYPYQLWRVEDKDTKPTQKILAKLETKTLEQPYPYQLWRVDPYVNGGKPYHEFLPDVVRLPRPKPETPPEVLEPEPEPEEPTTPSIGFVYKYSAKEHKWKKEASVFVRTGGKWKSLSKINIYNGSSWK